MRGREPSTLIRNFRLLWLGDTVNALGTSVTVFAVPIIAIRMLHATAFEVGLLTAARWLPALVVGLPAGAWSERTNKRSVLLVCNVLSAFAIGTVPVLAVLSELSIGVLYVIVAVAGALAAVFNAAYVPYLSVAVDPQDNQRAISRIVTARTTALMCGPAIGGVLASLYRPSTALIVDVASFVVSFVCLAQLPPSGARAMPTSARRRLGHDIREGIGYLRADPWLARLTVIGTTLNLLMMSYGAIELVFLIRVVGSAPRTAGCLLALGAIGAIAGAPIVPRLTRRIGQIGALRGYLLMVLPLATLICLTHRGLGYSFFVVGQLALALSTTGVNVIVLSSRQARVPEGMLARVTATMSVCLTSAMALGGVVGGVLATVLGTRGALWLILPAATLPGLLLLTRPVRQTSSLPIPAAR